MEYSKNSELSLYFQISFKDKIWKGCIFGISYGKVSFKSTTLYLQIVASNNPFDQNEEEKKVEPPQDDSFELDDDFQNDPDDISDDIVDQEPSHLLRNLDFTQRDDSEIGRLLVRGNKLRDWERIALCIDSRLQRELIGKLFPDQVNILYVWMEEYSRGRDLHLLDELCSVIHRVADEVTLSNFHLTQNDLEVWNS